MDHQQGQLGLTVTISAIEVARLRRRNRYLEAVLVQVLRDEKRIKEWFSAGELAGLRLPGLPASRGSITRLARSHHWMAREASCRGGKRLLYHFSSLPERAFQAMIDLVVKNPPPAAEDDQAPSLPPPISATTAAPVNAAPVWLLPLMRLVKGESRTVEQALKALPAYLPKGAPCPSNAEAREVLRRVGMAV